MPAWIPFFSARQLMWATLLVIATGILLLIPLFIGPDRVPAPWVEAFRSLHSAASLLLVVGALAHGVLRSVRSAMAVRAVVSGVLASTVLGLATVSGVMATAPSWWSARIGAAPEDLENWSSVFHFGYSAAILLALVFWHVRPAGNRMLPRADRTTFALGAIVLAAGLAVSSPDLPSPLSRLLAPTVAVWAGWSVLAPQLLWLGIFKRPRKVAVPKENAP